ncbi:MAG: rRNA maturation RNase YbeY [Chloroflexi bacterium]|nr:MAG: rRNA maturation RNase YbeY [Chloroflexota bacterium]
MSDLSPDSLSSAGLPAASYTVNVDIDDDYAALVSAGDLAAAVVATLRHQQVDAGEVTLVVAGDDEVRQLNRDYRGIDAVTDVLSFAAHDTADADAPALALPPELAAELDAHLGDIVIAYPYAARQAAHYGAALAAELRLLAVHGTLHLLGFDHDTPQAEAAMWAAQEAVLAEFGDRGLSLRRYEE